MKRERDLIDFGAMLEREKTTKEPTGWVGSELCKVGRALDRLAEAACNGELTDRQMQRQARLRVGAVALCKALGPGFSPIFGGDPRGCVLKLRVPSGAANDWGKDGYCVPY